MYMFLSHNLTPDQRTSRTRNVRLLGESVSVLLSDSLRGSLFHFLSGNRELREGTATEVT